MGRRRTPQLGAEKYFGWVVEQYCRLMETRGWDCPSVLDRDKAKLRAPRYVFARIEYTDRSLRFPRRVAEIASLADMEKALSDAGIKVEDESDQGDPASRRLTGRRACEQHGEAVRRGRGKQG